RAVQICPHDRRRDPQEFREGPPRPVRKSGRAEILASATAVLAGAAWPGDAGHDALAGVEIADALPHLDDLPARLVPHRHGQRDARMPAREELQIRAADDGRADPQDDLAGSRPRNRELALLVLTDG